MTAKLLSRMHEPLTRPSATLSPLRGARGTRHSHRECPSPRLRGEGAAKRRMRGSRRANLGRSGRVTLAIAALLMLLSSCKARQSDPRAELEGAIKGANVAGFVYSFT